MYRLVELSGLDDILYRGPLVNNKREGYGIQLFPNGYIYVGNWHDNTAHGEGKLLYTDGTYYEGQYERNSIVRGVLNYWNGRIFEGEFWGGPNEFFKNGTFTFSDGDIFEGKWNNFGSVSEGTLTGLEISIISIDSQKKLIKYDDKDRTLGKIIANDIVYEGGIKEGMRNGFGFIYSTFQHYNHSHFLKDCYNGFAVGNRISFGEVCEGHIYNDKIVHVWKRMTVRGYEVVGDVREGRYYVKFPFLNDDYFVGELTVDWTWNQNHHLVTLKSGRYFQRKEDREYFEIGISNCSDIFSINEVKTRLYTFDSVFGRISSFLKIRGLFEARDNAWDNISRGLVKSLGDVDKSEDRKEKMFKGTLINGKKQGFCQVMLGNGKSFSGFYEDGRQNGKGRINDNGRITVGSWLSGQLEGKAIIWDEKKGVSMTDFKRGEPVSEISVKSNENGPFYVGEGHDFIYEGRGRLVFPNSFEIRAIFEKGSIAEGALCQVKLDKKEEVEARYLKIVGKDSLAMFEVEDGKILLVDLKTGKHCWPLQ